MTLFTIIRNLHIIAGFVALLVFWIPLVVRKGGKVHRRIGWVYVCAMAVVAISAFYMGIFRVLFDVDADSGRISFSWFLIFVSILSASTAWYGLRVLRFKNRKEPHRHPGDLIFPLALIASGIGIGIYGYFIDSSLITYFPLIGLFLGGLQLNYWLKPPVKKMHWYYEHFVGLIACCISTTTAFAVFGAPRLLNVSPTNLLLWLAPTIVLVPVIVGYSWHYDKKFDNR